MPKQVSFEEENPLPVLRTPQQWKNEAAGSSEPQSDRSDSSVQEITASAAARSRSRRNKQTTSKRSRTEISDSDDDATDIGQFSDRGDSPEPERASIRAKSRSQKSRTAKSKSDSVQSLYHLHRNPNGRPGRPWRFPDGYAAYDLMKDPRDLNAVLADSVRTNRDMSMPSEMPFTNDEMLLQAELAKLALTYRGITIEWTEEDVRNVLLAARARNAAFWNWTDLRPTIAQWRNGVEEFLIRTGRGPVTDAEADAFDDQLEALMDMEEPLYMAELEARLVEYYDEFIYEEMPPLPEVPGTVQARAIAHLLANVAAEDLETAVTIGESMMLSAWNAESTHTRVDVAMARYIRLYNAVITNPLAAETANMYALFAWDNIQIEGMEPLRAQGMIPNLIATPQPNNNAAGEFCAVNY